MVGQFPPVRRGVDRVGRGGGRHEFSGALTIAIRVTVLRALRSGRRGVKLEEPGSSRGATESL